MNAEAPTAREPSIDVRNVSKWFGNVVAVNDISFQVSPGITGLVGSNGAGKTTLLRMITGLAKPSEGSVKVFRKEDFTYTGSLADALCHIRYEGHEDPLQHNPSEAKTFTFPSKIAEDAWREATE